MDRFGPRKVNATLLLVAAAGGAWFAHADSAAGAIAARALIGVGVSGALMSSLTAFVLWYPADRLSTMNAVAFSVGMVGAMTVTVPLELLLRVWHWREAFMLIVAATVAVSLLLWFWVPERTAQPRGAALSATNRGFERAADRRAPFCGSRSASAPASSPRLRCRRCGSPPGCATWRAIRPPRWRAACSRSARR